MTKLELLTKIYRYSALELEGYQAYWKLLDEKRASAMAGYPAEDDAALEAIRSPRDPDPATIRILQQTRYQQPLLHNHEYYEMVYIHTGEMEQQIEGRSVMLFTGDVCLIPPGVFHQTELFNQSVVFLIRIHRDVFGELFLPALLSNNTIAAFLGDPSHDGNRNDSIIYHTGGDRRLQELVEAMCLEAVDHPHYYQELIRMQLMLFLGTMLQEYEHTALLHSSTSKKEQQDYEVLRYMETNYQTVTLAELSEFFHFSGHYLSQKIRQLTGMSFMEYLQDLKMKHAVELLTTTNMKIKDISEALGYNNQEHYIRTFRNRFGQTPTQYRRTYFKA